MTVQQRKPRLSRNPSSGAPSSGEHVVGDLVVDAEGAYWVCTTDGWPGSFEALGGGAPSVFSGALVVAPNNTQNQDFGGSTTVEFFQDLNATPNFDTDGYWNGQEGFAAPRDGLYRVWLCFLIQVNTAGFEIVSGYADVSNNGPDTSMEVPAIWDSDERTVEGIGSQVIRLSSGDLVQWDRVHTKTTTGVGSCSYKFLGNWCQFGIERLGDLL